MPENLSAERFVNELETYPSSEQRAKYLRYFKTGEGEYGEGDEFMGVRMGQVFALAKEFIAMPAQEIEKLLESKVHEVRAGALSIMDKQARRKKTPESRRKELFDLYLRRSDRINNWDLVDLGAPYMVGRYLFDKPRNVLFELARSDSLCGVLLVQPLCWRWASGGVDMGRRRGSTGLAGCGDVVKGLPVDKSRVAP